MNILPWQVEPWRQIMTLRGRMPHAVLFHGQEGIGKTTFARFLAKSLLCESPHADGQACGLCGSCLWIAQGNHPDFRMLRPEAVDVAEGLEMAENAEGEEGETAVEPGGKKTKAAPSKEIKIEQVRALAGFLNVKTHRGGVRVALVYPAHAMNTYTANALLKMLEEPPPDTIFLLVTAALERLLPTIRSRCRKIPLATPERNVAVQWLLSQNVGHAERLLAEQGGAPLLALHAAVEGADADQVRERFLRLLADPERINPVVAADTVAKMDLPLVVGWLQRWAHDCTSIRLAGQVRYYPAHAQRIAPLAARATLPRLLDLVKLLNAERRVAEHPLNAKMFVERLLMAYVDTWSAAPPLVGMVRTR